MTRNLSLVLFVAGALLIYILGLPGDYVFDDYPNIVANGFINRSDWGVSELWLALWSGHAGPTGRPVAMLSFAFDSWLWDLSPAIMKLENIVIHGVSGWLLFLLVQKLARRTGYCPRSSIFLAAAVSVIWLVHPINHTSVLYIVQRMNSLGALFTLIGLYWFWIWRLKLEKDQFSWLACVLIILSFVLALCSKENSILLPLYFVVLEVVFFQTVQPNSLVRAYQRFLAVVIAATTLAIWSNLWFGFVPIEHSYQSRDFTIDQRLMTEFRVVVWYMSQLFAPSINELTLFHDDIRLSESLFEPVTTILSILVSVVILLVAALSKTRLPLFAFGVLMFFASQLIESFVFGLELAYEHRVYFGGMWLILAIASLVFELSSHFDRIFLKRVVVCGVSVFCLILAAQTMVVAKEWASTSHMVLVDVMRHPMSYRANMQAGSVYASKLNGPQSKTDRNESYKLASAFFSKAQSLNPRSGSACVAILILDSQYFHEVPSQQKITNCGNVLSRHIDASAVSSLGLLVKCMLDQVCKTDDYVLRLLDIAFDTLEGGNTRYRALVLAERARYYKGGSGTDKLAIILYRRALEISPSNQELRVELINLLVEKGMFREARSIALELKRRDRFNRFSYIYEALNV